MSDHGMDNTLHQVMPEPSLRMIISGPSGSGKGILTSEILLNHYKGKFEKIYYFSASALVDDNLKPLRKYCEEHLNMDPEKDPCLYDTWDDSVVEKILDRQAAVTEYMKRKGSKKRYHIAVICDDFANERRVVRGGVLERLYLRGRHINCSTFVLTQYYRLLSPAIRTNATHLACFRMRNIKDRDAIIEENAAIIDKELLLQMYDKATSRPFGFLLILLTETDPNKTFYSSFDTRLIPT